jgi:hypothetical protein
LIVHIIFSSFSSQELVKYGVRNVGYEDDDIEMSVMRKKIVSSLFSSKDSSIGKAVPSLMKLTAAIAEVNFQDLKKLVAELVKVRRSACLS